MVDLDSRSTVSLSNLLCQETETCLVDDEDEDVYASYREDDFDDEYLQILLRREISFLELQTAQSSHFPMISNWIIRARSDAVQWILNTSALFGFRFPTAYLSVTYFDRFLSRRSMNSEKYWAVRLLSVACLSLAAKMEECKSPSLSQFPAEEYNFESKVIQRMELLVLNTLEWRMIAVSPFAYIHYFLSKFNQFPRKKIKSKTLELVLATIKDMNLMAHRPSVIAGAATMVAMDQKLTKQALELKINALSLVGFLEIEDVFSCYNRLQELEMEKINLPKCIISPDLSPTTQLRGTDVLQNSSVTFDVSTKRKRLTNGCDQNYGLPDDKRQC